MRSSRRCAALAALAAAAWFSASSGRAADSSLEVRQLDSHGVALAGPAIPREAVRVFVYEGTPRDAAVDADRIAVDYGHSGVLFDRASLKPVQRLTIADGWPDQRPAPFAPLSADTIWHRQRLLGPGVLNPWLTQGDYMNDRAQPAEVVSVRFGGAMWRAIQPKRFLLGISGKPDSFGHNISWSSILGQLSEASYVESVADGAQPRRYTKADGLAGNIVTHLVPFGGSLWAASVDIYDPEAERWGPGGLSRYDPAAGRWQRVERIDGRPVRWVTLLETHGDQLWVGFREGQGVAGDKVVFGMGLYPGMYRPEATAIVLARLAGGKWSTFARKPSPELEGPYAYTSAEARPATPPTEYPHALALAGQKAVLFSLADAHQLSGNWEVALAGYVSLVDLETGAWRDYDLQKDLGADQLGKMIAEQGEILVTSNRGLHRFDPATGGWQFLDSGCDLKNSVFHTAAATAGQLWLGYGRQSFGVLGRQGISRYDEKAGKWTWLSPAELGTASPVRRIVAPDDGDVWVLFGEEPYMGAAAGPLTYFVSERIPRPTGLGRFADGRWKFPAADEPEPSARPSLFGAGSDIAGVGNRLVCLVGGKVYVGPKPWTLLCEGEVLGITPIKGGQGGVQILRRVESDRPEGGEKFERAVYTGGTDALKFETVTFGGADATIPGEPYFYAMGPSLMRPSGGANSDWVELPVESGGRPAVGNLARRYSSQHSVLKTPEAYWIFSQGEIIRLDRPTIDRLAPSAPAPPGP